MTNIDIKELRGSINEARKFNISPSMNCDLLTALLDRLEAAERERDELHFASGEVLRNHKHVVDTIEYAIDRSGQVENLEDECRKLRAERDELREDLECQKKITLDWVDDTYRLAEERDDLSTILDQHMMIHSNSEKFHDAVIGAQKLLLKHMTDERDELARKLAVAKDAIQRRDVALNELFDGPPETWTDWFNRHKNVYEDDPLSQLNDLENEQGANKV